MIEVVDRVPTYPGRVVLLPVSGQANTYDLIRADEPIVEGTPINKALFDSINTEMATMMQQVSDSLLVMSQRVDVGALSTGAIFGLYENGVMVPYIKLVNNYARSDRALVVRKDCIKESTIFKAGTGSYIGSEIDLWLNNEFISTFDVLTQDVIDAVDLAIAYGSTNTTTNPRRVFLLSLYEYNLTLNAITPIGEALKNFSTPERKRATFNGTVVPHWTRSHDGSTGTYVTTAGTAEKGSTSTIVAGIRPAFTLPLTFEVTAGISETSNVITTA